MTSTIYYIVQRTGRTPIGWGFCQSESVRGGGSDTAVPHLLPMNNCPAYIATRLLYIFLIRWIPVVSDWVTTLDIQLHGKRGGFQARVSLQYTIWYLIVLVLYRLQILRYHQGIMGTSSINPHFDTSTNLNHHSQQLDTSYLCMFLPFNDRVCHTWPGLRGSISKAGLYASTVAKRWGWLDPSEICLNSIELDGRKTIDKQEESLLKPWKTMKNLQWIWWLSP